MAKKLNQTRYTRAKLVVADIVSYGKHYAFEYGGADGLSIINVNPIPAPTDIKAYLEGNLTLTSYPVSSNISKLCAYALASFPNLESVYLFKNDDLVELEQDAFFGLDNLDSVYVPDTLFDSYVATYPQYEDLFKKIITTMDLVVPTFTGVTKLTKEIFTQVVGMLESAKKNAIERVVVPAQYSELGTECFEAISQLPICDTIVLEAVTNAEADFMKGINSISYIQIENADFSLQGVADSTGTANFKWLTPIAYMHDYIHQDYVKDYYITGYARITNGQAMPSREEYGYWKWFSSPTTTDDTYLGDSETYPIATYTGKAYAFLMIDTLFVKGTGDISPQIVLNAINSIDTEISPLNLITRVVLNGLNTNVSSGNNSLDIVNTMLPNVDTLIMDGLLNSYGFSYIYSYATTDNNKFTTIYFENSSIGGIYAFSSNKNLTSFVARNLTTFLYQRVFYATSSLKIVKLPKLNTFATQQNFYNCRLSKLFIGSDLLDISNQAISTLEKTYVKANKLVNYIEANTWANFKDSLIGVIDGFNIYVKDNFTYPKLSATLTLDTTNGHLKENGTDLFTGYTATWYSDEDCTQVISDLTTITESTTAYVKLTVDPNYFSEVTIQGKSTPSSSEETVITKGFTSGGEHFTQLYIYEDGEVWYLNGSGSVQAYANGVWEIEYKTLQFDSGVELTDEERIALLNNYDKI